MGEHATSRAELAPTWFNEPTFAHRVVARLIDIGVAAALLLLTAAVADGAVRTTIGVVLVAAYEIALVTTRGQTVGKMAMRTKVVDQASGSTPSLARASTRWLTVAIGSLVALAAPAVEPVAVVYAIVVVVPIIRPPLHRGLHDLAARTVVTSLRDAPAAIR